MLVLTRKQSEMIQIGDHIVVKVIHAGRNTVKIGIEAPQAVRVLRAELCDPPEAGHPLAAFLGERRAIRSGGLAVRSERATCITVRPKAR
ncbi:MAG TPA: carbon storage regulator [Planctomycetaceae bacterium]|jgi:carbon storage regulator|nr:carbon storage regulator [Planctomycetaceae bacterium]